MLSSFSDDSATIGEDSSYFLCTCGAEFELIRHYGRHLREAHQIKSIIIIPDIHDQKQSPLSKTIEMTQQSSGNMDANVKFQDQEQNSISSPDHHMRSKEERRDAIEALSKGRFTKKDSDYQEKTINWQGFKLVKNRQCRQEPYFCGNCETIFFKKEDYITHCTLECRTLIHLNSSHTITLNTKQEETSEDSSDIEDQESDLQESINPQQTAYTQMPSNPTLKQIVLYKLDHRSLPFYCGQCKIDLQMRSYQRHFLTNHGSKICEDSSHIIVKCCINLRRRNLYFSPNVLWIHQEKAYSCLCDPSQKMSMKHFIEHIKESHAGTSPQYQLQLCKRPRTNIVQKMQLKSTRIMKKDISLPKKQIAQQNQFRLHSNFKHIYDIIYKQQDHRKILPFSCGYCPSITFSNPICYKRHIQAHRSWQVSLQSSHVVLQIRKRDQRYNIYLSPAIRWYHDQLIYFCPCSIDDKMSMSTLLQHIITEHQGISPLYYGKNQLKRNLMIKDRKQRLPDVMKRLRKYGVDHKDVPFKCHPCELEIENGHRYRNHIRNIHGNIIHPSSSHIILFFKKDCQRQRTMLLLSSHFKQKDAERSDYYCSCQPHKKITIESLVQHVIEFHKGVSPEYVFNSPRKNNYNSNAEQFIYQEAETSEDLSQIEDYDERNPQKYQEYVNSQQVASSDVPGDQTFKKMLRYNLDHRNFPFYCGQCKTKISIYSYYRHFQIYHEQKIDKNSSHILVKCRLGSSTRFIYLSPSIRWSNQDEKYYCACNYKEKLKMDDLILHIQAQHNGISPQIVFQQRFYTTTKPLPKRQIIKQIQPYLLPFCLNVCEVFYNMLDHRERLPFSCGYCPLLTFKNGQAYHRHICTHQHEETHVPSSHVILKLQNEAKKRCIYLCPSIKWHHEKLIYCCPCNIDNKMTMNSLLQHIIAEHRGVSPPYSRPNKTNKGNYTKQTIKTGDAMRILQKGYKDQKDVPFRCFPCDFELKDEHKYRAHMRNIHQNRIHPSSSHIILLFNKYHQGQRTSLLICSNTKWKGRVTSDYYCPCTPERKITMETLVKHVIEKHDGVSPQYSFDESKINSQDSTTKSRLKIEDFGWLKQQQ